MCTKVTRESECGDILTMVGPEELRVKHFCKELECFLQDDGAHTYKESPWYEATKCRTHEE